MLSSLKKLFQFCYDNFFLFSKLKLKNIFCFYFMDNLGLQNGDKKTPKNAEKFVCELCDFRCSKQSEWDRHCLTLKHEMVTKGLQNGYKKTPKNATPFMCSCGKQYNYRQGLSRHKKQCNIIDINEHNNHDDNDAQELKEFMKYLMNENSEMKTMMMEVIKNGTHNTDSHNTTTNSHNKAFNLQFFLNETCKDAMNIMDFVESIQLQLSDLERVGEKGFVDGISNIIIKNLKNLDVTQRPVHCTDKKRETIYVKDQDKWEKDDANVKMHKLVRKVQDKNFKMVQKFKEKYPDYNRASSKHSDTYNHIIIESMGGKGDNDFEKEEKIIKKVSKEITVEK